ncbi:MAG: succinylglutamate desuccinylase/aspartoacylase family protein [Bacteroidota bacterium]
MKPNTQQRFWLKMIDNGMSQTVNIPVIVAKGKSTYPVLGLTAAIHGNEINGIPIIHEVMNRIDIQNLEGTVVAVPGLNAISLLLHQRRCIDEEDLNRNFPGKVNGNRSQQYVWQINQKILTQIDYLIDMHTASFGRENTLYVRADLGDEKIAKMAFLQDTDIILDNKGIPSTNEQIVATRTMRAEAMLKGIPTITVEYGNPQVYQSDMTTRGVVGVENVMSWLGMTKKEIKDVPKASLCKKSFWTYVNRGGYLEVPVALNQKVKKGEVIGVLRNPFGDVIQTYYCPQDGIVIGKSSNPVNMNGGRIIHLGILDEKKN